MQGHTAHPWVPDHEDRYLLVTRRRSGRSGPSGACSSRTRCPPSGAAVTPPGSPSAQQVAMPACDWAHKVSLTAAALWRAGPTCATMASQAWASSSRVRSPCPVQDAARSMAEHAVHCGRLRGLLHLAADRAVPAELPALLEDLQGLQRDLDAGALYTPGAHSIPCTAACCAPRTGWRLTSSRPAGHPVAVTDTFFRS